MFNDQMCAIIYEFILNCLMIHLACEMRVIIYIVSIDVQKPQRIVSIWNLT